MFRIPAALCAALAACIALLALTGAILGLPLLATFGTGDRFMSPLTSVFTLLLSLSILLVRFRPGRLAALTAQILAATVVVWCAIALAAYSANTGPAAYLGSAHVVPVPGLVRSLQLIAGLALVLAGGRPAAARWRRQFAAILGLVALGLSLVALLSHASGAPLFHGAAITPMSLPAALSIFLLGLAILGISGRDTWPLLMFQSKAGPGGASRLSAQYLPALALLSLAVLVGGAIYLRARIAAARRTIQTELATIGDYKAREISNWHKERRSDAEFVFQSALIQPQLQAFLSGTSRAPSERDVRAWMEALRQAGGYESLALFDGRGRLRLAASASATEVEKWDGTALQAALRHPGVTVQDLHRDEGGSHAHFSLWVPIGRASSPADPATGALMLRVDPNAFLYPLIQTWPTASASAETLLARREGGDVVFLNELRHRTGTALTLRFPIAANPALIAAQAVQGREGLIRGTDYRGAPTLAVVRAIPGTPWFMVAKVDEAEIHAPLRNRAWLTGIGVFALITFMAFAWALALRHHDASTLQDQLALERERKILAERLQHLMWQANDAIFILNAEGRIQDANQRALEYYGYSLEELRKMRIFQLRPPELEGLGLDQFAQLKATGSARFETLHQRKDGSTFPVQVSTRYLIIEGEPFAFSSIQDISERKAQEEEIGRLGRLYAALSQVNQAIVWSDSRESLLAKICEVLVEFGQFKMAWIGWNDPDSPAVRPVASCGDASGYLRTLVVRRDDSPEGQGPVGTAIREEQPCIFNDFLSTDGTQPWREAARQAGFGSVAAFPVRLGGKVQGAIAVYADGPGFFGEKENLLLIEAAMDVSFALDRFASEAQRQQAEAALRISEERLRFALEGANDGLWDVALPSNAVYLSPRGCEILGYLPGEMAQVAQAWNDLVHPEDLALTHERLAEYLAGQSPVFEVEQRLRTKSGAWKWVLARGKVVAFDGEGRPLRMTGTHTDITQRRLADAQLRDSEARFRAMFDKAPMGIVLVDSRSRRILQVNDRFTAIMGRSRETLFETDWASLTHPDDLQIGLDQVARLNAGEIHGFTMEKRYLRPDGTPVWVNMAVERISSEGDARPVNLCTFEDISDRKQAEKALRDSEQRLRLQLEHMPLACILWDRDWLVQSWNPAASQIFGYPVEEAMGLRGPDLVPESARTDVQAVWSDLLFGQSQASHINENLTQDGRTILCEWTNTPILDDGGRVTGVLSMVQDITEQVRAEERLRKVSLAIEQSPVSVVISDPEGNIEYVNPKFTAVTGYSLEEALGRNPRILSSGEQPKPFYEALWRTLGAGETWEGEFHNRRKDGGLFWEYAKISPIRNAEGTITGYVAVKEDITARKQAEAEHQELTARLQQAQKLESLGALAGGVAHDINNVLAAILSLASAHREGLEAGHPLAKSLETISNACQRGRDVVKGLLYFARKDLDGAGPVDLNVMVRDMVQLLAYTTLKRVQLEMDLQEDLEPIHGDSGALSHALMNLCVNALDAMPHGGSLRIRTRSLPDGRIQLAVRDSGQGMDEEIRKRALEPFFTTKAVGKGTGLGLSMVFGTMQAHGGTVEIESEPGQGTEVALTFSPARPEDGRLPGAEASPSATSALRILLVDDDELIRLAVGPMLEMMGHQVATASDGYEAIHHFEAGLPVDLVVLDMNMPGLNGSETLDRLLALRPDQAVLMASGYHDQDIRELMAKHPGIHSLQKPFSVDDIQRKFMDMGLAQDA
jgi:PAS domain S-box-containing protein